MESFSQFGEDVILWQFFQKSPSGFFVEVGANHPTVCSQTWFLELQGWNGILVEPLPGKAQLLREQRPRSRVFQAAMGAPEQRGRARFTVATRDSLSGLTTHPGVVAERFEEVEVKTLDDILAEAGNPKLDFVSIDVEGSELQVLHGFDLGQHRPAILILEDHLQRLGAHRHLVRNKYRLVKRTGCNNWYVPQDAPFSLSTHAERFRLWKEIHLDTPVRCVRFFIKRRLLKKTD
jgi:FkbM family methyltransferase